MELSERGQAVPELVSSAAHVFVDDLCAPLLGAVDSHHLFNVLRLRDGEVVTCADGSGRWRSAIASGGALIPSGEPRVGPDSLRVTVACAIPKGDRPEQIVQQLTELGVARIVLMNTDRGVVRWAGERATKQLERLRRVAREASMQSRRCRIAHVDLVASPRDVLDGSGPLMIAVPGAAGFVPTHGETAAPTVLIGPEGGWSDGELLHAQRVGATPVGLGSTVLRVETAAVVAALLCALR